MLIGDTSGTLVGVKRTLLCPSLPHSSNGMDHTYLRSWLWVRPNYRESVPLRGPLKWGVRGLGMGRPRSENGRPRTVSTGTTTKILIFWIPCPFGSTPGEVNGSDWRICPTSWQLRVSTISLSRIPGADGERGGPLLQKGPPCPSTTWVDSEVGREGRGRPRSHDIRGLSECRIRHRQSPTVVGVSSLFRLKYVRVFLHKSRWERLSTWTWGGSEIWVVG